MSLADRLRGMDPQPARILVLDIETSPALAYTFQLRDVDISPAHVVEPSRVLCFGWKWHGGGRASLCSEWEHGRQGMVETAWRLLDEADMLVTYNGVRFDVPHLQREMVARGYGPPSPWIDVDLLTEVRRNFRFMSAKLGNVVDELGLDAKMDSGGFGTWRGVLDKDPAAQRRMGRYCRTDVEITDDLFTYLRPWLRLPHAGLFTADMRACHACGGKHLTPDGISRTKVSAWLRLLCGDCGAHNRLMVNGETRPA